MEKLIFLFIGCIIITTISCKKDDNGSRTSSGTIALIEGEWLLDGHENQGATIDLELCEFLTSLKFNADLSYRYRIYEGDTDCNNHVLFNFTGSYAVKDGVLYDEILELRGTDNTFAFEIVSISGTELVLAVGISEDVFYYVKP
jgi:hypothetical protein